MHPVGPRLILRTTLLAVVMVFIAGEAFAGGCTLPVDVSNRIGRAQTFVYNIPDLAVLKGKRDYIWDSNVR